MTWIKLKYVARLNQRALGEDIDPDYAFRYVDIGAVTQGLMRVPEEETVFGTAPSRARRLAKPGDVVISTVRTYLKAVATVPASDDPLVFSTGFAVVSPRDSIDHRYLAYQCQGERFVGEVVARSFGVSYPAITATELGNIEVLLPSPDRQRKIAAYLDEETAQVDAVIRRQNLFIATLQERRAAVITRAVTLGLDSGTGLKDSGVPWLGRIPRDWPVKKLKYLGRATIGLTYTPADVVADSDPDGTLVLRAGNIREGRIVLDDNVYVTTEIPASLRLREGDILICSRNGSARLIGKNAMIDSTLAGETWGAFMTVLRSPMNPYLQWVLSSSMFHQQLGLFTTSTINQLTSSMLHNFEIAVPPTEDQERISAHLAHQTQRIDALIEKARRMVSTLRERRTALISEAVLGSLDVDQTAKAGVA